MQFFTRNHWNRVDILWFVALLLLALWVLEPAITAYINPTEKQHSISPHE